jgi:esterase/lipase
MEYENIFFPSLDGISLEGWFIPTKSEKLIICNHPMTMNRYGFPGHLEPWKQFNPTEVNLVKIYKELHNAGYNVLAYDMRNHGTSSEANGGVAGTGLYEWRDVVGALQYVENHEQLKRMVIGLFNPCAGGNAAMVAMSKQPEVFKNVKAFVCPQPASMNIGMKEILSLHGLGEYMNEFDDEMCKQGGFTTSEMSPHPYASNVKIPTFIIQVREDVWSKPDDVQITYDLIPLKEKKLFWIDGTTQRFDGYNYFGRQPDQLIDWFDNYMKQ